MSGAKLGFDLITYLSNSFDFTDWKKGIIPGPEMSHFTAMKILLTRLPHVLIILSYSKTSKLVSKIHAICKVLDPIPISNTKKLPKMTIVEVVIKFITIYQLSYQYRLGMKLCWCCCCCSSSEETSPQQPHWLVQLIAGSSLLLSQYSFQKWH